MLPPRHPSRHFALGLPAGSCSSTPVVHCQTDARTDPARCARRRRRPFKISRCQLFVRLVVQNEDCVFATAERLARHRAGAPGARLEALPKAVPEVGTSLSPSISIARSCPT